MPLAGTTKMERLNSTTDLFEAGKVFLPKQAHWLHDYRSELTGFPGAGHDDQVDSTSQALTHLKNSNSSLAIWEALGKKKKLSSKQRFQAKRYRFRFEAALLSPSISDSPIA